MSALRFAVTDITFVLAYMVVLIKDLADPFEYEGTRRGGSTEAPLGAIHIAADGEGTVGARRARGRPSAHESGTPATGAESARSRGSGHHD